MKIVSYNVNGIRAAIKKGLVEWIRASNADIICLQETKAQPEQIPLFDLEEMGYISNWFSAKKRGYSGVAILTKTEPDKVVSGMNIDVYDVEGRLMRADYGDVSVISVYHPSGSSGDIRQAFKMKWLEDFQKYINELKKERPKLIISGDYNICHKPIDIHDPIRNATSSGFLPEEREWMSGFLDSGFIDSFRYFNEEPHQYSWWSYRANARANNKGWRIDYNMVSNPLENKMNSARILPEAMHSDHCPVVLDIDF
ncbi:MAG: exodeoxyribonuclease III [Bacteroidales bacterium]|nr:exodeoxyribonuclease III [Bacteroidales bacterium]MCF8344733.1 exodeoxyribonuclease III [Bacteroidales bacterium]MCF8350222.1 exodeoxyribonuclease III [Bacteroidales bacterium]MCF8375833.1 exodeoxyribonuclease III [Bacteroidales bacterium]MCF8402268.1 exodeoxyribonuclease III [Bacteroidales bacterium]